MRRRLAALLLALATALALMSAPPAAADDGALSNGVQVACQIGVTSMFGAITGPVAAPLSGPLCDKVGDKAAEKAKQEWTDLWNSALGDLIKSAEDVVKWMIKTVLTVALQGPSLDLSATGLFGTDATLAGMLVWLGWVIATFALMWQLGKMALTGQMRYAGQALVGWVQNAVLSGVGLTVVAALLKAGDALTAGVVNATFNGSAAAYQRISAVMMPNAISNPVIVLGVVTILLLVGFIQLVLIFLRQSAILIQCLLLPIAGAGRVGGDTTRQWAPRLITSIWVVIGYKPIVAVIICTGFAEFGQSQTLAEWLRGLATLVLAVLAPGPLTRLFAPIGAEMGAGLSAGGAVGAAASVGAYLGGRGDRSGSDDDDGSAPPNAVDHARYVERAMGSQRDRQGQDSGDSGGSDAVVQAARNDAAARPGQDGAAAAAEAGGAGAGTGAAAGAAAAGPGLALTVLDGVNDAVQRGSNEMGTGAAGNDHA